MRDHDFEPYHQHLRQRRHPPRFFGGDLAALGVIFCVLLVI